MSKVPSHKRFGRALVLIFGMLFALVACVPEASTAAPGSTTTTPATTVAPTTSSTTVAPTTTSTTIPQSTVWNVSTKVVYSSRMVAAYGNNESAVRLLILNQLQQVEGMFVGFSHTLKFNVTFGSPYADHSYTQAHLPHPGSDLLIVYDVYNTSFEPGGGWDGGYHSIVQSWHNGPTGGPFDDNVFGDSPTRGLAHEVGHSFGAIDIYAMDTDWWLNPFSTVSYRSESSPFGNSMMRYPFSLPGQWDAYSRCIIEKSNGQLEKTIPVVSQTLPTTYKVQVKTASGANVPDASVTLYPVHWYTYGVSAVPLESGTTGSDGIFKLTSNPFHPMEDMTAPWRVAQPNIFVRVVINDSQVGSGWLPLAEAGLAACNSNGTSPVTYTVNIVLP